MARIDSLRLLLAAQPPDDIEAVEVLLRAITERIDELQPGSPAHQHAHRRIDELLTIRDQLIADQQRDNDTDLGGG